MAELPKLLTGGITMVTLLESAASAAMADKTFSINDSLIAAAVQAEREPIRINKRLAGNARGIWNELEDQGLNTDSIGGKPQCRHWNKARNAANRLYKLGYLSDADRLAIVCQIETEINDKFDALEA